jgi:hypothetical protein
MGYRIRGFAGMALNIRGRICPGPTSDVEERDPVSDPESGRITDPGSSIVVSVYLIAPNGTQVLLEESEVEDGSFLCSYGASAGFFPDAAGNFTFYGVAKWSQNDSINKVRSNNVSILVKPAIYQTSGSEVLAENVQIDRLMDLSPDGESILALDIVVDSPDVSFSMDLLLFRLIDPDSFETIVLPFDTKTLQFARFSPSGDKILIVGEPYGQDRNQVISYNLADGNVTVVAASMQDSDINSAVWVKGQKGDEIAYGEKILDADGSAVGYRIWLLQGTEAKVLYETEFEGDDNIVINDSDQDGKRLLVVKTRAYGFPHLDRNLTTFDIETGEFTTISQYIEDYPRFSPAGDLVIFDDGPEYRAPGGPIRIVSVDGAFMENINTGEPELGYDPYSFVVSPDGRYIVTLMNAKLIRTELIHAVPEFGNISLMIAAVGAVSVLVVLSRIGKKAVDEMGY